MPFLRRSRSSVEQARRVGLAQRRGRLVEQQHLGVQRQGAGDLRPLLLPGRQRPQRHARIDVAAHARQDLLGPAVERGAIDDPEPVRLVAEQHVRADVQILGLDQLLPHQRHAQADRVGGAGGRLAVDRHRAGVRQVHARRDLHERRLAGAVAAQEAHDLAGRDVEVDPPQRAHAAEGLFDSFQREGHGSVLQVPDHFFSSRSSFQNWSRFVLSTTRMPVSTKGGTVLPSRSSFSALTDW